MLGNTPGGGGGGGAGKMIRSITMCQGLIVEGVDFGERSPEKRSPIKITKIIDSSNIQKKVTVIKRMQL